MPYINYIQKTMSEWVIIVIAKWAIFYLYHGENKYFQWNDDDVRFVLDQQAELDLYSAIQKKSALHKLYTKKPMYFKWI